MEGARISTSTVVRTSVPLVPVRERERERERITLVRKGVVFAPILGGAGPGPGAPGLGLEPGVGGN